MNPAKDRRPEPVSVQEAAEAAPSLGELMARARASQECLQTVLPLLPAGLRGAVKAGPIEGDSWCLLVANSAACAKLRQLVPALASHLRTHGHPIQAIRLKIAAR